MADLTLIATEVFTILQSYDYTVMLYDDDGNRVAEPSEARRMFARPENMLISIIDDEENSEIRMFIGKSTNIDSILGLITALRSCASKFGMLFNISRHKKKTIEPKNFVTDHAIREHAEAITDSILNEMKSFLKSS